jgi:hypothetical protein
MAVLLFLTSAMLFMSGALKVRSAAKAGMGQTPFPLLELLVALGLAIVALPGGGAVPAAPWAVFGAFALLLVSSTNHAFRIKAHHERRSATEAGRLANYVKYMSTTEEDPQ